MYGGFFFKGVDHMQNEQKTVGIGVQDFSKLREENLFYIDKTGVYQRMVGKWR